jgi:hypothetical protein
MQISKNIQADSAQALAVPTGLLDQTAEQVIAPADEIVAAAQAASSAALT